MKNRYILPLILLASSTAFAEKDEHREHGAHEHGHAQLNVVVEKNEVIVMLETPSMNVFGFEHEPKNKEQEEVVHDAIEDLEKFGKLLSLDKGAHCHVEEVKVNSPFEVDEHNDHKHDEHKKDDHDDHKHDEYKKDDHDDHKHEEHKKDDHDDHKHEEHKKDDHGDHKHDEHKEVHSDVDLEASFHCDHPEKLSKMNLSALFKRFPLFEELDVKGVINGKQTAVELDKKQSVLSLKK